ncbi:MAG: interleukin-like EMT inducer domain-containing protein, partial [Candidatus Omnitrophota bacterium]|nr:interleukin-like EMT inducer domain-containing protein [Candidatus Omnitrophota bacterium]
MFASVTAKNGIAADLNPAPDTKSITYYAGNVGEEQQDYTVRYSNGVAVDSTYYYYGTASANDRAGSTTVNKPMFASRVMNGTLPSITLDVESGGSSANDGYVSNFYVNGDYIPNSSFSPPVATGINLVRVSSIGDFIEAIGYATWAGTEATRLAAEDQVTALTTYLTNFKNSTSYAVGEYLLLAVRGGTRGTPTNYAGMYTAIEALGGSTSLRNGGGSASWAFITKKTAVSTCTAQKESYAAAGAGGVKITTATNTKSITYYKNSVGEEQQDYTVRYSDGLYVDTTYYYYGTSSDNATPSSTTVNKPMYVSRTMKGSIPYSNIPFFDVESGGSGDSWRSRFYTNNEEIPGTAFNGGAGINIVRVNSSGFFQEKLYFQTWNSQTAINDFTTYLNNFKADGAYAGDYLLMSVSGGTLGAGMVYTNMYTALEALGSTLIRNPNGSASWAFITQKQTDGTGYNFINESFVLSGRGGTIITSAKNTKSITYYKNSVGEEQQDYTVRYSNGVKVDYTYYFYDATLKARAGTTTVNKALYATQTDKSGKSLTTLGARSSTTKSITYYAGNTSEEIADYTYGYLVNGTSIRSATIYYYGETTRASAASPTAAMTKAETHMGALDGIKQYEVFYDTHFGRGEEVQNYQLSYGTEHGYITTFSGTVGSSPTTITSTAHGLINGDTIWITGATTYDGKWTVSGVTANTFTIPFAFVSNVTTGTWTKQSGVKQTSVYFYGAGNARASAANRNMAMNSQITFDGDKTTSLGSMTTPSAYTTNRRSQTFFVGSAGEELSDYAYSYTADNGTNILYKNVYSYGANGDNNQNNWVGASNAVGKGYRLALLTSYAIRAATDDGATKPKASYTYYQGDAGYELADLVAYCAQTNDFATSANNYISSTAIYYYGPSLARAINANPNDEVRYVDTYTGDYTYFQSMRTNILYDDVGRMIQFDEEGRDLSGTYYSFKRRNITYADPMNPSDPNAAFKDYVYGYEEAGERGSDHYYYEMKDMRYDQVTGRLLHSSKIEYEPTDWANPFNIIPVNPTDQSLDMALNTIVDYDYTTLAASNEAIVNTVSFGISSQGTLTKTEQSIKYKVVGESLTTETGSFISSYTVNYHLINTDTTGSTSPADIFNLRHLIALYYYGSIKDGAALFYQPTQANYSDDIYSNTTWFNTLIGGGILTLIDTSKSATYKIQVGSIDAETIKYEGYDNLGNMTKQVIEYATGLSYASRITNTTKVITSTYTDPAVITSNFNGNGSNKIFTVSGAFVANSAVVYVGGVKKTLGVDYTETDGAGSITITFFSAPATGTNNITINYVNSESKKLYGNTAQSNAKVLQDKTIDEYYGSITINSSGGVTTGTKKQMTYYTFNTSNADDPTSGSLLVDSQRTIKFATDGSTPIDSESHFYTYKAYSTGTAAFDKKYEIDTESVSNYDGVEDRKYVRDSNGNLLYIEKTVDGVTNVDYFGLDKDITDILAEAASSERVTMGTYAATNTDYISSIVDAYGGHYAYWAIDDANPYNSPMGYTPRGGSGVTQISTVTISQITSGIYKGNYTFIISEDINVVADPYARKHTFTLSDTDESDVIFRRYASFATNWIWAPGQVGLRKNYSGNNSVFAGAYITYTSYGSGATLQYIPTALKKSDGTTVMTLSNYGAINDEFNVSYFTITYDGKSYDYNINALSYLDSSNNGHILSPTHDAGLEFGSLAAFALSGYKFKTVTDPVTGKPNPIGVTNSAGADLLQNNNYTYLSDSKAVFSSYRVLIGTGSVAPAAGSTATVNIGGYSYTATYTNSTTMTITGNGEDPVIITTTNCAGINGSLTTTKTRWGNFTLRGITYSAYSAASTPYNIYLTSSGDLGNGSHIDAIYTGVNFYWYNTLSDTTSYVYTQPATMGQVVLSPLHNPATTPIGDEFVVGMYAGTGNNVMNLSAYQYGANLMLTDLRTTNNAQTAVSTASVFASADIVAKLTIEAMKVNDRKAWLSSSGVLLDNSGFMPYRVNFSSSTHLVQNMYTTNISGNQIDQVAVVTTIAGISDPTKTIVGIANQIDGTNSYIVYDKDGQKLLDLKLAKNAALSDFGVTDLSDDAQIGTLKTVVAARLADDVTDVGASTILLADFYTVTEHNNGFKNITEEKWQAGLESYSVRMTTRGVTLTHGTTYYKQTNLLSNSGQVLVADMQRIEKSYNATLFRYEVDLQTTSKAMYGYDSLGRIISQTSYSRQGRSDNLSFYGTDYGYGSYFSISNRRVSILKNVTYDSLGQRIGFSEVDKKYGSFMTEAGLYDQRTEGPWNTTTDYIIAQNTQTGTTDSFGRLTTYTLTEDRQYTPRVSDTYAAHNTTTTVVSSSNPMTYDSINAIAGFGKTITRDGDFWDNALTSGTLIGSRVGGVHDNKVNNITTVTQTASFINPQTGMDDPYGRVQEITTTTVEDNKVVFLNYTTIGIGTVMNLNAGVKIGERYYAPIMYNSGTSWSVKLGDVVSRGASTNISSGDDATGNENNVAIGSTQILTLTTQDNIKATLYYSTSNAILVLNTQDGTTNGTPYSYTSTEVIRRNIIYDDYTLNRLSGYIDKAIVTLKGDSRWTVFNVADNIGNRENITMMMKITYDIEGRQLTYTRKDITQNRLGGTTDSALFGVEKDIQASSSDNGYFQAIFSRAPDDTNVLDYTNNARYILDGVTPVLERDFWRNEVYTKGLSKALAEMLMFNQYTLLYGSPK